jgi:hypothetical protein
MLAKYNMDVETSSPIPMHPEFKFFAPTDEPDEKEVAFMSQIPYREMIGSLMYLMVCLRLDISVAVTGCAKYCSKPRRAHYEAVKLIFRYLLGTQKHIHVKQMMVHLYCQDTVTPTGPVKILTILSLTMATSS